MRCLDADPEQRPRSVAEVAAALPGSDPLAAALAAGEILLAANGGRGWKGRLALATCSLRPAGVIGGNSRSWPCWHNAVTSSTACPWRKAHGVLEDDAKDVISAFGYTDPPADTAFGFAEKRRDYEYVGQLELERSISNRRELLKDRPLAGDPILVSRKPQTESPLLRISAGGGQLPHWS